MSGIPERDRGEELTVPTEYLLRRFTENMDRKV